jgi:hypothetical protein
MKSSLFALLFMSCTQNHIQPNTYLRLEPSPINPTAARNDRCINDYVYEISGVPHDLQLRRESLHFQLYFPEIKIKNCATQRCLGGDIIPTDQTSFYTDNVPFETMQAVYRSINHNPKRIKVFSCAYDSVMYVLALQTSDFSVRFHDSRNQIRLESRNP